MPELAEEGSWLEAPLWVWTAADPRRRRLWARSAGDEIVLSDRQSWEARLPLRADGHAGRAVERLLELQRGGVRIRSRALVTTLWARLALGDLFIHGIGGAKYDRVTDLLIERFFGLRPPGFMVVSATLLLPIERDRVTDDELRAIRRELRDLTYHPERYLDGADRAVSDLMAAKRRWIETPQTAENARQRCRAIREVERRLAALARPAAANHAGTPGPNAATAPGGKRAGLARIRLLSLSGADFARILVGATSQDGVKMV